MKCNCCGITVSKNIANCTVCGYPLLAGNSIEIISNHRGALLKDITLNLKCYDYEVSNGELKVSNAVYKRFFSANELSMNNIKWYDSKFDDFPTDKKFVIDLMIKSAKGTVEKKINVSPKEKISRCMIGAFLTEGFNIALVVGNENKYVISDTVTIL